MFERDGFSWNIMVFLYVNVGRFMEVREIFSKILFKSFIIWNLLIFGYCCNGCENGVFELFL